MQIRSRQTFGVVAALAVLAVSGPSWADPPGPNTLPISVTTIKTEESDALADALTTAVKAEVRAAHGWSLAKGDYSLEVLSLALRCPTPPDAACELRIADKIKTDRFIWGTIDEKDGKAVGALHLWTRGKGETSVPLSYSANLTDPNDDALRQVVKQAIETLTGGPPKGAVKIKAGDVNGQVFVDGKPAGAIRDGVATVYVPVGKHDIEVRAPGYATASGRVEVSPTKQASLSLALVPEEKSSGPNMRQIATYGAFGMSGAFLVAGLYSSLRVNSINSTKRDIVGKYDPKSSDYPFQGTDICDAADSFLNDPSRQNSAARSDVQTIADGCDTGKTLQITQFVFYGLSAVSLGAGAYLLMTDTDTHRDDTAPANKVSRVHVLPAVGQSSGSLTVQVSF